MSELNFSRTIAAPVEVVFDAFADVHGFADRVDGIERVEVLTDGEIGLGTRFRETRIMFGKEATEEMEFTQFQRNQALTVSADSCGSHFDTIFHFRPQGAQTHVDIKMVIQPTTWMAKLMSPLSFVMRSTMKKMMDSDFDQIQAYCESKAARQAG